MTKKTTKKGKVPPAFLKNMKKKSGDKDKEKGKKGKKPATLRDCSVKESTLKEVVSQLIKEETDKLISENLLAAELFGD